MTQVKENNVVEGDFKEVEAPVEQVAATPEEATVNAEVTISAMSNGEIRLNVSEEHPKLSPAQIEALVKQVYEQLHDQRIVSMALEVLKAKLG